jgi:hypothetical protein
MTRHRYNKSNKLYERQDTVYKLILIAVFYTVAVAIALLSHTKPDILGFVILGLAANRCARTLSFNTVAKPVRDPFCTVKPDSCKAGDNVHAKFEHGWRAAIGQLLECPICTGTWSALVLYGLWSTRLQPIVYVLAVASFSEGIHWFYDLLEWSARACRCVAGKISPDR